MADNQCVLLGIINKHSDGKVDLPSCSKLGGSPVWLSPIPPIDKKSLQCAKCQGQLFFIAQIYAPIRIPRTLYMFGCNSTTCGETIGRDQSVDSESNEKTEVMSTHCPNWADDTEDDWSDQEECADQAVSLNDLEMLLDACHVEASRLEVVQDASQIPSQTLSEPQFPPVLLEVIEEPHSRDIDFSYEHKLYQKYVTTEAQCAPSVQGSDSIKIKTFPHAEVYEQTPTEERHFIRFQERLKRCPQQCLRYDYDGEPLWPIPIPSQFHIPKCKCGKERKFECQLMPAVLYVLQVDKCFPPNTVAGPCGMDWLSLLVYSCPDSCDESREEFVHVVTTHKSATLL
ncbi:unnamed protein product [Albugo candida]|uniref:Programmed cell death protein 2 C-terminal domain-containing protein n=1 Tax=Albugo candida TaxID=65357 RepID=A0A024GGC6_9STRA|nr:unnamed protein product [Albugo candida]|eukprot:CCI45764.1 unnamed protein product [Albugo candida]